MAGVKEKANLSFAHIAKEDLLSLLGGVLYFIQLWNYAHTTLSRLDESAYIYKGYLFATGQYQPFDPGIWTNKAPFAFLIPGYIQAWFGPGLRPARYFAVLAGIFILLGTWLTARRLGGKKTGAIAIWIFVLSPALIKLYSPAISQGLIALMLTWVLAFSLGGDRPLWQLMLSAALAGLMILTRQNMVAVLPLLILYIFWQYGLRAGLWSFFSGLIVVALGHLLWWPDIMQLWLPWLPSKLYALSLSFFEASSVSSSETSSLESFGNTISLSLPSMTSRILSLFRTYRFHVITFTGILSTLFLWKNSSQNKKKIRDIVFLATLFLVLLLMHTWASLGQNYCVYCFSSYFGFYGISGILLVVLYLSEWKKEVPKYLYPFLIVLILVITTGIGYSAFEDMGDSLLNIQVPRIKDGHIISGYTTLENIVQNKFSFSVKLTKQYTAATMGLGVGAIFLSVVLTLKHTLLRKQNFNFGYLLFVSFFLFSFIASPIIAGNERKADYNGNIISAYEEAGEYLGEYIPAESTVYWDGGSSLLPLLYIPGGVNIYLPQLNARNNYRLGGDSKTLYDKGYWNETLENQWKSEAEYIVVNNYFYTSEWDTFLDPSDFDEFPSSTTLYDNRSDFYLRVFRRK